MAFQRPTLSEIVDRVQQDMISRLSLAGAVLRRSFVYVVSRVLAGAAHMLHGHIDYVSRQLFADTSEAEFLRRQGGLFGVTPTAATYARAAIALTGTAGTAPAGTTLTRADGTEYTLDADATLASGTATGALTAKVAGADGSLAAGMVLSFQSPISGIDASVTVTASTEDGSDEEDDDAYRVRFLAKLQSPPQGGAGTDYVAWAKEVSGVTRAWVYPRELGAGTVTVRFVRDNDPSQIPDLSEVAAVQTHIDAKRPVTAAVTVAAPVAVPRNFTVHVVPDTVAVRAAVTSELSDLLARDAIPGATLLLSQIRTAIGIAGGLTDYTLVSPSADVTHSVGQLPTLGTVTYV